MILEQLNIIQNLTGGQKLHLPGTYLELQIIFLILPLLFLTALLLRSIIKHVNISIIKQGLLFLFFAIIHSAIWKNYGANLGAWIYDENSIIGKIGWIPVEVYIFLLCGFLLTAIFTILIRTFKSRPGLLKEIKLPVVVGLTIMYIIFTTYIILSILGWELLNKKEDQYFLLGIVLGFFAPIYALEWLIGYKSYIKQPFIWLLSWLLPGVLIYLFDSLVVNQGIMVYDYKYTTNLWIFNVVNLEILLIYLALSKATAQLFLWIYDNYYEKTGNTG